MTPLQLVSLLSVVASAANLRAGNGFQPDKLQNELPLNGGAFGALALPPPTPLDGLSLNMTVDGQHLFEGDMVLTPKQLQNRKGFLARTWPNGIVPFVITSSSSADRSVIQDAISHWRSAACLTFSEKTAGYRSGPHLRFIKSNGCWSHVGRQSSNSGQSISIGQNCETLGIVVHEIGHALGFFHEQSRRDRDSYITVSTGNIQPGYENNFRIETVERALGVPYDLSSVMHYGGFGFSSNGLPTIVTNDIRLSGVIGQRNGLSHRDKQLANLMYECDSGCSSVTPCRNGGFADNSCDCVCPPGTGGNSCETVTGRYYGDTCGDQDITQPGTITSRNYPSLYPPGEHCVWIVTAPAGKRVRIQFGTVKVIFRSSNDRCYWDWISLHLDGDSQPDELKCGSELQNQSFTSEGSRLALEMHAFHTSYPTLQTGFTADVTFV